MSSLHGDKEVHRSGDGVLTLGKDIGIDMSRLQNLEFDKSPKSQKILFINPPVDFSVFYGDGAMDLSDTKSSSPPIGILHLASMAREYGYQVKILDAHAESSTIEQILKLVAEYKPDIVCLTAMTIMIDASAQIAKSVKEYFPEIITMIGGVHVTAEPIETLRRYPQFDFAVIGEGEIVLIEFLEKYFGDRLFDRRKVLSLVWRSETGEIIKNPRRSFFKELDDFPWPAFDLVGENLFSHYRLSVFGTKKFRSIGLVTSRGCTGHCTFCDLGAVGRGFRYMHAPYLISHLNEMNEKYQVNDLLFYDDMFTGNRQRLEEFCHAMIAAGNPFTWSCCSRVDFVQYLDILKLMKDAGCHTIEFGIESGCQRIIDSMRKNVNKEKVREVINKTHEAGIVTKGNFIFGLPGETHDSIRETIQFARSLKLDYAQHTFLQPLPGSELYETAGKYGNFDPAWDKFNTFRINFIPTGFTQKDLTYYSKFFWRKFYLRPQIIFKELKKLKKAEDFSRLWLALKSFIKITLFRKSVGTQKVGLIH